MFTRQLLIVFPDLILCPLSFPSSAFSFRLRDAAPIFAKLRQSPLLNIQPSQRCSFPFCSSLFHCLTRSRSLVSPYLSFPIVFSLKAQEQPALGGNTGPAKEFIEFVVQLIPWRQARVESWLWGGEGVETGGMEGSGEQGGRANVKGWQLHRRGLIENNTAKSQLERILFKFTLPYLSPNTEVGKVRHWNNTVATLFYPLFLFLQR